MTNSEKCCVVSECCVKSDVIPPTTLVHAACLECARRAGRARTTLARDLEPCADRVMETISEDAEAELELGNFISFHYLHILVF